MSLHYQLLKSQRLLNEFISAIQINDLERN